MACPPSPPHDPRRDVAAAVAAVRADPGAERAGRVAATLGLACHAVGGTVRDRLLGRPFPDLDLVVEREGGAFAAALAAAVGGRAVQISSRGFPLWRIVARRPPGPPGPEPGRDAERPIDLWDRQGAPLAEDLARRDFTVNAMAVSLGVPPGPGAPGLEDPFGGLADLAARRLRAVEAANLVEDPLRVLRAARLAAQLHAPEHPFRLEAGTAAAARRAAPLLDGVAGERLRDELERLFRASGGVTGGAVRGAEMLEELGVHPGLWLRLLEHGPAANRAAAGGREAGPPRLTLSGALRGLETIAPDGSPLGRALDAGAPGETTGRGLARWTASFLALTPPPTPQRTPIPAGSGDSGEPATAVTVRALGGAEARRIVSATLARRVRRALAGLDGLLALAPRRGRDREHETERRWWLHTMGNDAFAALALAGVLARGRGEPPPADIAGWLELAARPEVRRPRRWLTGEEIAAEFGIAPGPRIGELLRHLERETVAGRVRSRDEAGAAARIYLGVEIRR